MLSNATTDGEGKFSIMMDDDPLLMLYDDLSSLLSGCNLVVPTPLSNCNTHTRLPSVGGTLISTLRYVGISRLGTRSVANIAPSGFHFMPST